MDILSSGDPVNELLLLLNGSVEFIAPDLSLSSSGSSLGSASSSSGVGTVLDASGQAGEALVAGRAGQSSSAGGVGEAAALEHGGLAVGSGSRGGSGSGGSSGSGSADWHDVVTAWEASWCVTDSS